MKQFLGRLFGKWRGDPLDAILPLTGPYTVGYHNPVNRMPPSIRVEPMSVVLHYRGLANHVVVRETFAFGTWCGEHGIAVGIKTPGDGTVHLIFGSHEEEIMFRLHWSEKLVQRKESS